jgi:hypothetical protein
MSGSSKRSLSLRFPYRNAVCTSSLHHTCYVPCPSHSSLFIPEQYWVWSIDHWAPHYVVFSTLGPLRPNYSRQRPILNQPRPTFLPQCKRPSFTPKQNIILYFLIFKFFDTRL